MKGILRLELFDCSYRLKSSFDISLATRVRRSSAFFYFLLFHRFRIVKLLGDALLFWRELYIGITLAGYTSKKFTFTYTRWSIPIPVELKYQLDKL